ncbi:MAG: FkbM family methyltransferase [Planctomycetes bacterium]|nr:FkbM family methyltransferase [Planctomycetota bacterium]
MQHATRKVRLAREGLELEVLAGDAIIGPAIERGNWEEHETRLFRAHLAPGARVVDLGANVGWFTVQAVLEGCEVHAFEPVPWIADVLERNARAAELVGPGRAIVHRAAAGSARGTARIALAGANFGDNRLLDAGHARPADMDAGTELEIAVERVDDLVHGPVRVLKIDTQGSEWHALQGAQALLEASPRIALLLEFWPYALRGATPDELLRFLAERGFRLGKATAAPYPMRPERILRQALARDPVKGGLDLYGTRGLPFHVGGPLDYARALWRSWREA